MRGIYAALLCLVLPALLHAQPDGHTLVHVDTSFTSNPSLFSKLPYDSIRDFAPVSLLASAPVVLIVHPSVPVKSLRELIQGMQHNITDVGPERCAEELTRFLPAAT